MNTPHHRLSPWLALGVLLAVLICAAGVWATPFGRLPQNELAQARWRAQGIRHYRMTARFSHGWISNGPWTVEVRDEQVVSGYDATSGAPLSRVQLRLAQLKLPISTLFALIHSELYSPALGSPRDVPTLLVRAMPPLRRYLDRCAVAMPEAAYDPVLSFPSGITLYGSPCFPEDSRTVLVTNLTPLP